MEPANCGSLGLSVRVGDEVTLCMGFQPSNGSAANGGKVLFRVKVDSFSKLRVDTRAPRPSPAHATARARCPGLAFALDLTRTSACAPLLLSRHPAVRSLMGQEWSPLKHKYSSMWVGLNGRRTIGQHAGVVTGPGTCNATAALQGAPGKRCYGWITHNKPVITEDFDLSNGLTAIVHLEKGVVNRIVWDSSCNLCKARSTVVTCLHDRTDIVCPGGGQCKDCYARIPQNGCTSESEVCAPHVYVAWLGTDRMGTPMLSAGSVLSRFAEGSLAQFGDQLYEDIQELGRSCRAAERC